MEKNLVSWLRCTPQRQDSAPEQYVDEYRASQLQQSRSLISSSDSWKNLNRRLPDGVL